MIKIIIIEIKIGIDYITNIATSKPMLGGLTFLPFDRTRKNRKRERKLKAVPLFVINSLFVSIVNNKG